MEIVHKNSRAKSTFTMGSLLWKLRIPAKVVPVEVTMNSKAISEESLFLYSKCVGKKLNQIVLDFETVSILCLGDKISELSKEAFMTFVTLPVAKMGLPWREYLGILEVLSFRSKRLCFVRGNQENVLTSEL
ncbi:hypothetical protein MHBO_004947 [Bonamia ostreae]|uniref:SLC12A transporter C-terminal domain-containing protein n=1 Tax=Bonamia ostreae TaxID=126728 RepID=A0ABV2AUQ1_9EUKA